MNPGRLGDRWATTGCSLVAARDQEIVNSVKTPKALDLRRPARGGHAVEEVHRPGFELVFGTDDSEAPRDDQLFEKRAAVPNASVSSRR